MKLGLDFLRSIKYKMNYRNTKSEVKTMSPRTGRPKSENPLNIDVKVRLDSDTSKRLDDYCKKHGITRTEAIRKGIHLLLGQEH